jgi:3-oxoadipate enol-lactonase
MGAVPLNFTVDGPVDGPVLVLASSLGTTGAMWQPQLADLTRQFRVVHFDHRGHGASPVPPGPYRMSDLGGDVVLLLDQLGVERVHCAGISMGGMVALWLAENHPDRVDRLVLACTTADQGSPANWQERAELVRSNGMIAIAETVVGRWLPPDYAAEHPWQRAELVDAVLATPVEGYASCCAAIASMDLLPGLATVVAPTLVIAASLDQSTPAEQGRRIAEGIPHARFELIEGAAHLANISHASTFNRLVTDFLTG